MIKLFRDTDIGGSLSGGPDPIPEDVRKKILEKYPEKFQHLNGGTTHHNMYGVCDINYYERESAEFGYSLSLPTIQAQEERIRVLEEENARVNTILERIKNEFGDISDMIKKAINL